jgi:hypothetical protein
LFDNFRRGGKRHNESNFSFLSLGLSGSFGFDADNNKDEDDDDDDDVVAAAAAAAAAA